MIDYLFFKKTARNTGPPKFFRNPPDDKYYKQL